MSTTEAPTSGAAHEGTVTNVDLKLEAIVIPVSDLDRASATYIAAEQAGEELPT